MGKQWLGVDMYTYRLQVPGKVAMPLASERIELGTEIDDTTISWPIVLKTES